MKNQENRKTARTSISFATMSVDARIWGWDTLRYGTALEAFLGERIERAREEGELDDDGDFADAGTERAWETLADYLKEPRTFETLGELRDAYDDALAAADRLDVEVKVDMTVDWETLDEEDATWVLRRRREGAMCDSCMWIDDYRRAARTDLDAALAALAMHHAEGDATAAQAMLELIDRSHADADEIIRRMRDAEVDWADEAAVVRAAVTEDMFRRLDSPDDLAEELPAMLENAPIFADDIRAAAADYIRGCYDPEPRAFV